VVWRRRCPGQTMEGGSKGVPQELNKSTAKRGGKRSSPVIGKASSILGNYLHDVEGSHGTQEKRVILHRENCLQ